MYYVFDKWMIEKFSKCPWERYADDGIIHCISRKQAEFVLDMLKERMKQYGLSIHPEKGKIVFFGRNNEPVPEGIETSFVFLGYCFRPRLVKSTQGIYFMGFTPAVSVEVACSFRKKVRETIRKSTTSDIIILSQMLNPVIRGWMDYFCKFTPSEAFQKGINYVNQKLVRWIRKHRKKVKRSYRKAQILLKRIALSNPKMFYQWQAGYMPMQRRQESFGGDYHVRFCERLGVKFPLSTRPKWKCQYHIVFIPKYRKKQLYGRVIEIIRILCQYKNVEIVDGAVCVDHVHLCASIPPKMSVFGFMGYLKGKSALMIFDKHPELRSKYSKSFWARGYYVAMVGNLTEEPIKRYIREQSEESRREDSEGAIL